MVERSRLPATTLLPRACPAPGGNALRLCADRKLYATVELGPGPIEPAPFSYIFSDDGIWFSDQRQSEPPRPVAGFHTLAALVELLEHDPGTALAALADEEISPLLYPHQADACAALETAVFAGSRRILIAAAPGAGKTLIGVEAVRRLVGAGVARRALYLVESAPLAEQAAMTFATHAGDLAVSTRMPDDRIGPAGVCVLALDDVLHRLVDAPLHGFDLIVADECDAAAVTEAFDAIAIGLTSTPDDETTARFGEPVFTYGYERGVREDMLVPHVVVAVASGARVGDGDRVTGDITAPEANLRILNFVRQRAEEHRLRFGLHPKTLVLARDDAHAEQLAMVAGPVFGHGEDFVVKITGATSDASERLHRFRDNPVPGVAVSDGLLAAGVDIPDLEFLVILRPAHTPGEYARMVGRGTRLGGKQVRKTSFVVFDCFDGTLSQAFGKALRHEVAAAPSVSADHHYETSEYLTEFGRWVRAQVSELAALESLLVHPENWRPEAVITLRDALATGGRFTEAALAEAYGKPDADIISMVKHAASPRFPLLTAKERAAVARRLVFGDQPSNAEQAAWIARIEFHLAKELAIDREDFLLDRTLVYYGGWATADATFGGQLDTRLAELNRAFAGA